MPEFENSKLARLILTNGLVEPSYSLVEGPGEIIVVVGLDQRDGFEMAKQASFDILT